MDTKQLTKYELVWLEAWKVVASSDCASAGAATRWADSCLSDFENRFRSSEEPK
jgi:hypothetical protein